MWLRGRKERNIQDLLIKPGLTPFPLEMVAERTFSVVSTTPFGSPIIMTSVNACHEKSEKR